MCRMLVCLALAGIWLGAFAFHPALASPGLDGDPDIPQATIARECKGTQPEFRGMESDRAAGLAMESPISPRSGDRGREAVVSPPAVRLRLLLWRIWMIRAF